MLFGILEAVTRVFMLPYATCARGKIQVHVSDVQVLINNSVSVAIAKARFSLFIYSSLSQENRYQRRVSVHVSLVHIKDRATAGTRQSKIKTPRIDSQKLRYHDRQDVNCDKARSGRHIHKNTIKMEMDQRGLAIARNRIDKNQPKSLKE
jgi:hypothetical protein